MEDVWFWLIVGVIVVVPILKVVANQVTYSQAQRAYREALAALTDDPANTALRQEALRAGRALADAGRQINAGSKTPRVVVHDELAIRNDLDAIQPHLSSGPHSLAQEIEALAALEREGVLTSDELARLKGRLTAAPSGVQETLTLLRGLKALEREGVLTPGEFNLKKWDLLAKRLPMER
jgi:hypothetical protein